MVPSFTCESLGFSLSSIYQVRMVFWNALLVTVSCVSLSYFSPCFALLSQMMVNSLKLYADNLLCMDLCSWPHHEARDLLGDEVCLSICLSVCFILFISSSPWFDSSQMMHHLQRRKDNQEIWGCRHVVEARFGMIGFYLSVCLSVFCLSVFCLSVFFLCRNR